MKELSIEEKAKAYDKVIEVLKERFADKDVCGLDKSFLQKLFPELKESEDEGIRKSLIDMLKNDEKCYLKEIAWLEEQGQHKKFRDSIQVGDKVTRNKDGVLVNLSQLNRVAKKQGEQKPADKVEPKFHEGEWIVKNDDSPINIDYSHCKITKVENGNYTIESIYGYKGYNTFETFEKDYHLWTIQDAKDGDVLFTSSTASHETFIFKSIDENGNAECYFAYDSEDGFREGKYHFIGSTINCKPATKKQYDTLMKVMTDKGYTFDFKKKELKKIEKKFNEWSEEDEKMLKACTELVGSTICANYGEEDGVTIESCRNWLKNWTKEDKERYISCLQKLSTGNPEQSETINSKWFKEHVYPQSQWKPSEEQIKALSYYLKNDIDNDGVFGCQLVKLYQDLKKLREE